MVFLLLVLRRDPPESICDKPLGDSPAEDISTVTVCKDEAVDGSEERQRRGKTRVEELAIASFELCRGHTRLWSWLSDGVNNDDSTGHKRARLVG